MTCCRDAQLDRIERDVKALAENVLRLLGAGPQAASSCCQGASPACVVECQLMAAMKSANGITGGRLTHPSAKCIVGPCVLPAGHPGDCDHVTRPTTPESPSCEAWLETLDNDISRRCHRKGPHDIHRSPGNEGSPAFSWSGSAPPKVTSETKCEMPGPCGDHRVQLGDGRILEFKCGRYVDQPLVTAQRRADLLDALLREASEAITNSVFNGGGDVLVIRRNAEAVLHLVREIRKIDGVA